MDFATWFPVITPVIQSVAIIVGAWLAHRIVTPKDHERAELLSRIAGAATALVLANNPNQPWSVLLDLVVREITMAAGVPTKNAGAIKRAAAAALTSAGVSSN